MAAQSKTVPLSGHEMVVAHRCIARLDTMKNGLRDERPKRKSALQNVLNKTSNVVYLNSVLSLLYDYGKPVMFSYVDEVLKDDQELDKEIAELVLKRCAESNRTLHVLPCDSNLHTQMRSQIKSWYDVKENHFDLDNPVQGIAAASCLDYELYADQIYVELVALGYVKEEGNNVNLQLPEEICMQALEKGLKKWEEKIANQLGEVTVRNYQRFSDVIIEVNADIQSVTAKEMGHYCEKEYSKMYPVFKTTLGENVDNIIDRLSVEDMEVDEKGKETTADETMDTSDELPTKTGIIFPLSLQPEVAYAMIQLGKMDQVATTMQAVINQIQPVCNITYIVSPKYILSSLAGTEKTSKLKGNFTVELNLGRTINKKSQEVSEVTILPLLLSFPGKQRVLKKYNRKIERQQLFMEREPDRQLDPISVSMEDCKEILKGFQQFIFNNSKSFIQRRHATIVLNDAIAEARCKERMYAWLDSFSADPTAVLTEDMFTKKLLELSLEESYWPSESVIENLAQQGYLELQNDEITYNPSYRGRGSAEDWKSFQTFLARWNSDLKPSERFKPREGKLVVNLKQQSRKRSGALMAVDMAKKAKVLDL